ncbi:MAG: hypothetical protein QME50_03405 [Candidatus Bathyarchaeota archaeon]|nr:hypothetical protein [Candidatus Bathyarchaeota archaeon]
MDQKRTTPKLAFLGGNVLRRSFLKIQDKAAKPITNAIKPATREILPVKASNLISS